MSDRGSLLRKQLIRPQGCSREDIESATEVVHCNHQNRSPVTRAFALHCAVFDRFGQWFDCDDYHKDVNTGHRHRMSSMERG